jgi:diguanylate cyclase (GGDEF)-like protein
MPSELSLKRALAFVKRRLRLRSLPRLTSYPLLGAAAALVIPAGLPFIRLFAEGTSPRWALVQADLFANRAMYAYVTLSSLTAMTSLGVLLSRWSQRALRLAATDSLTGLFNRRHFAAQLSTQMGRDRRGGRPTCVMCIDLDHLKAINDSAGHQAGDRALVAVAEVLSANVRADDFVARFGGDEFAVLLPGTSADQAVVMGERILSSLARRNREGPLRIGVSIGIAELSATATPNQFLVAADAALYWSKKAGGGRVSVAPPEVLGTSAA